MAVKLTEIEKFAKSMKSGLTNDATIFRKSIKHLARELQEGQIDSDEAMKEFDCYFEQVLVLAFTKEEAAKFREKMDSLERNDDYLITVSRMLINHFNVTPSDQPSAKGSPDLEDLLSRPYARMDQSKIDALKRYAEAMQQYQNNPKHGPLLKGLYLQLLKETLEALDINEKGDQGFCLDEKDYVERADDIVIFLEKTNKVQKMGKWEDHEDYNHNWTAIINTTGMSKDEFNAKVQETKPKPITPKPK